MKSILVTVFDGLQPAQVTPELMPNLSALASEGVAFNNHHSVFPSVTRINATSMVTGRYPGAHGLAANTLVVRDFDPYLAFSALEPMLAQVVQKTGRILLAPTLADILSQHGSEYIAIGTGTSGNAYVHNPNAERSGGATIHPEFCLPYSLNDEIIRRFGPWPQDAMPGTPRLSHAVKIMTEYILAERKPAVALIWFNEPDHAHHAHGVGSDIASRAIREADEQFGRLLAWLDETGRASETDVMVLSDHGYSTIKGVIDVEALVRDAGFPAGSEPGGVIVAPNGGAVQFYVRDSDWAATDRLARWLMAQPWCGAILASQAVAGIAGTLPASLVGNEGERAPELAMSFRWDSTPNDAGFVGHA
ncbi:MAG: alkaline phosphatase family protein, partial [Chloroflexi bacterium]|nr:alkaline phosphatase family protein [Chloroflexota bacterium]